MSARKLQQEVDRCFKRVAEGIAAFESTFEKIQQATNQPQKEKLEDTLKREIKKLQRQRDLIKSWAAGAEIKDKKPLVEHRKAIETVRLSLIDRLFVLYIWCGFRPNLSYHMGRKMLEQPAGRELCTTRSPSEPLHTILQAMPCHNSSLLTFMFING